jgi:hypothetical protein
MSDEAAAAPPPPEVNPESKFTAGGDKDLSKGPVPNRGCTDIVCIFLLIFAWGVYIAVTIGGLAYGNPKKLYSPRDYSGAYCDVETNWNNGPNLAGFTKVSYTMNVSATTDQIVKQMICSSVANNVLTGAAGGTPLLSSMDLRNQYLCDCCLMPCKKCDASLSTGGDISDPTQLGGVIGGRTGNLQDPMKMVSTNVFNDMWSQATKYFNQVCMKDCNTNFDTMNASGANRSYVYSLPGDSPYKQYWDAIMSSTSTDPNVIALKATITSSFTFKALPYELCPYPASKCVPTPGVAFSELYGGYCGFQMSAQVVSMLGSATSNAFTSLGGQSIANASTDTFGEWCGQFFKSIDSFVLTCLVSFAVAFCYMVLLRFLVGVCVWFAVVIVLLMFLIGGAICWVKSTQCAGVGVWSTAQQTAVAVAVAGSTAATNLINQQPAASEALSGDGADYVGVQRRTITGRSCTQWGTERATNYTNVQFPLSNLNQPGNALHRYCRNPYNASFANKAKTIWCFTGDSEIQWESCLPIGVISPVCQNGYAVAKEWYRKVLEVCSYVLWILACIYIILVICFVNRIRLAIAVNKVAAQFIAHTPTVLLVPITQAVLGALWVLAWAASIAYLVSQVPDGWVPTDTFASYAEAYGTDSTAGKCTNRWPTGGVYKDEDNCKLLTSGNSTVFGCWKCSPPRYIFDVRFGASFFVFLWNNALNVAIGQCIIAGAVGVWFFTPNAEKGTQRAVRPAIWNVFRYHLGSVAFGAFIIAVIQFIRYLMYYYEQQAKAQKNRVMVLILKVLQCIIWCFEKCVKFLNKNAYIQIALLGTNFCTSAKNAFFLILRNGIRFATIALLGTIIHYIGFFFIVVATVIIGYFIVTAMHVGMSPILSLVVYTLMSYVVAQLFMSVFGLAVDSTLQCFLACEEMGLSGDFVPPQMASFLKAHPESPDSAPKEETKPTTSE